MHRLIARLAVSILVCLLTALAVPAAAQNDPPVPRLVKLTGDLDGRREAVSIFAQKDPVLRPIGSVDGKALYTAYCAQCHGLDGKGNGVRAQQLRKPPADLTRIAARSGFNEETVIQYIMGTSRPGGKTAVNRATGKVQFMMDDGQPADMPSWGFLFRGWFPEDNPRVRFANLARYLKSIQEK